MHSIAAWLARIRVPVGFALGVLVLWLSHPTAASIALGGVVGFAGEAIRLWAAGHLEKGREVTRSGPYRLTRHPLYVGSTVIAAGLAIASTSLVVAVVVGSYLVTALTAAIRTEEALLRQKFGGEYDAYAAGRTDGARRFSWARARANREYRAVIGLLVAMALLALKMWLKV